MSWYIHAGGPAEAIAMKLGKEAEQSHHNEHSRAVVLAIRNAVEALAAADDTRQLYVATEGHVDANGGRFSVSAEVLQP